MKKVLNPKRIKISVGIMLILCFGLVLDSVSPVKNAKQPNEVDKYTNDVKTICSWLTEYYGQKGELPDTLFGGDKKGWSISGRYQVDPLISSGLTDAFPTIRHDSLPVRKAFTKYKIMHPDLKPMFGHDGNTMGNVAWMDIPTLKSYSHERNVNPLAGNFYYKKLDPPTTGFVLFAIGDSFNDSFDLLDAHGEFNLQQWNPEFHEEPYSDGIRDGLISGRVMYINKLGKWNVEEYHRQQEQ